MAADSIKHIAAFSSDGITQALHRLFPDKDKQDVFTAKLTELAGLLEKPAKIAKMDSRNVIPSANARRRLAIANFVSTGTPPAVDEQLPIMYLPETLCAWASHRNCAKTPTMNTTAQIIHNCYSWPLSNISYCQTNGNQGKWHICIYLKGCIVSRMR